jgi:hypothetical protein
MWCGLKGKSQSYGLSIAIDSSVHSVWTNWRVGYGVYGLKRVV